MKNKLSSRATRVEIIINFKEGCAQLSLLEIFKIPQETKVESRMVGRKMHARALAEFAAIIKARGCNSHSLDDAKLSSDERVLRSKQKKKKSSKRAMFIRSLMTA